MVVVYGVVALAGICGFAQAPAGVRLGVPERANATPSIAAAGSRVAIAWSARDSEGKTDIHLATSNDGGRTFAAPVRVNDEPGTARVGGELPPRVVFSGTGIDVLWTARGEGTSIRLARSDDGGRTFGKSRALQHTGVAGDRGWPALAADAKGRGHAIWLDHRGLAAQGGARHVHGAAANADEKRDGVAMAQKSSLFYSDGASEHEIAKGVCYCCKTALAAAPDGTLFAAWRHVYPDNIRDIAFTVSRDGGRTFAPFARVSQDQWQLDGCPDDGPALAVDGDGVAHVVWPTVVSVPEPHKAIFYASTRDGRTFTPRVRISPEGRNAAHPQVAFDPSGRLFVVWDEIVEGRRHVFAARSTANRTSFLRPAALASAASASYPVVIRAGKLMVAAWTEGGPTDSVIHVQQVRLDE